MLSYSFSTRASSIVVLSLRVWPLLLVSSLTGTVACHDLSGLAGTQQLPSGTQDPKVYRTAAGALALYQNALADFQFSYGDTVASVGTSVTGTTTGAFVDFVFESGLLTDELQDGDLCPSLSNRCMPRVSSSNKVDARQLGVDEETLLYGELQGLRNGAALGIGALAAYDSAASPALRGHLYALTGYAELLLADYFCAGVPLSTLNFNGTTSYTYAHSSTTDQVYHAALAEFDTAIALSGDSARIQNLAWVGKSRALLSLDSLSEAAQAAAHVPDGFAYQFQVDWVGPPTDGGTLFNCTGDGSGGLCVTVADREGSTGIPYRTSHDPRTVAQVVGTGFSGLPLYAPVKYGGATPEVLPITVADWIEARLIRAEGALHAGDVNGWLMQLNYVRQHASVTGQTETLAPLTDPGATLSGTAANNARVSLLFQERAYWLFLTGHRQGDLRRLIRQYGRSADQVYPTGPYPLFQLGMYGEDVTAQIPATELINPLFHGCLSRGA